MNTHIPSLLAVCLLVFFTIACANEHEKQDQFGMASIELQHERDIVLTGHDLDVITVIREPLHVFSDQASFLVTNKRDSYKMAIFDTSGTYITSFGARGRGPGEFLSTSAVGIDYEDHIFIYDLNQDRITKFDNSGNYIKEFEGLLKDRFWIRGGPMLLIDGYWHINTEIAEATDYNAKQAIARTARDFSAPVAVGGWDPVYADAAGTMMPTNPMIAYDAERGQIIVVHRTSPNIRVLDKAYQPVTQWVHESPNFMEADLDVNALMSRDDMIRIIMEISLIMQPFIVEDYFIFHYINQYEAFYESRDYKDAGLHIGVYNLDDGNYLGEIELPYRLIGVIAGKLVLLKDDNPDAPVFSFYRIKEY